MQIKQVNANKILRALFYLLRNLPLKASGIWQAFVHIPFTVSLLCVAKMEAVCCKDILHRQEMVNGDTY